MRPGSPARAKSPASAMGRAAAQAIRRPQHRRLRAFLPDGRAAAIDAGLYRSQAVNGPAHDNLSQCPPKERDCKFDALLYDDHPLYGTWEYRHGFGTCYNI